MSDTGTNTAAVPPGRVCDCVVDPDGDTVITLKNPNALSYPPLETFSELDEPRSRGADLSAFLSGSLAVDFPQRPLPDTLFTAPPICIDPTEQKPGPITFRVSSERLIAASPVFKAVLTGGYKEGKPVDKTYMYEIDAEYWDVKSLTLLMYAIHAHPGLPRNLGLKTLAKMAFIVDYYEIDIESMAPWAADWTASVPDMEWLDVWSAPLWLTVGLAFACDYIFEKAVEHLLMDSYGCVTCPHRHQLPICAQNVIEQINMNRRQILDSIVLGLATARECLLDGRGNECCYRRRCMHLGRLSILSHGFRLDSYSSKDSLYCDEEAREHHSSKHSSRLERLSLTPKEAAESPLFGMDLKKMGLQISGFSRGLKSEFIYSRHYNYKENKISIRI
ncbi:hypothetical protein QBC34DRAFT_490052 [Podospora aff. communis PSN243]|uniref:BTB domain-containing protein n=1 Tax=Podospora aff. communis PSN243 TaxID=3040156 RepID=A0AAV9H4I1_9PEZI|nr:hypothetical protein QBC34DRAFT_490052 [Podospora aff. communis PSN243]